jgi:hypothetical protein
MPAGKHDDKEASLAIRNYPAGKRAGHGPELRDTVPMSYDAEATPVNAFKDPAGYRGNGDSEVIYAYNVEKHKRIGGMKVRVKIRVLTGTPAARLDARQSQAIRELLQWAQHHHPASHGRPQPS